jgi:hypothetical protein
MKNIIGYLRSYFNEEIRWPYFITVVLLLGIAVFADYRYELARHHVDKFAYLPTYKIRLFILYAIPFIGCIFLYMLFYSKWKLLTSAEFIMLALFTVAIYVYRCDIAWHRKLVTGMVQGKEASYYLRVANQLVHGLVLFVLPLLWWVYRDRKEMGLYGWKLRGVNLRPYFISLLVLVPLVALASTQKDFLKVYPIGSRFNFQDQPAWENLLKTIFFEVCYGFDFLMNEFFFRGFIILAFVRYMGKGIILPMAVFYVFIHLGKPAGETISSFFGGLILGVIAFETRSIAGGVILHLGIAYLMEIGGAIGRALMS